MTDRTPKPCRHKTVNHQHGDYLTYVTDRCRCIPCVSAYSEYAEWLGDRRAVGRPSLVPDRRARQHVKMLRESGWPVEVIAQRTGVSKWTVGNLINGKARRIHITSEKKILAFAGKDDDRTFLVDATGTRRRVEALMSNGWPLQVIAKHAGMGDHTLNRLLLRGGPCRPTTREAIRRIYDELWDQPPPVSAHTVSRTTRLARKRGYVPPLAWDDDELDDPDATPHTTNNLITLDQEAIGAERLRLYLDGLSDPEIAERVGTNRRAIYKWRERRGLQANREAS